MRNFGNQWEIYSPAFPAKHHLVLGPALAIPVDENSKPRVLSLVMLSQYSIPKANSNPRALTACRMGRIFARIVHPESSDA